MVELDESLGEAIREKYVFQIEVPQGSTRKEALATMHHAFTKESKRINLEAMKEKVEKEKLRNKRERIFEECAAAIKDATEVDKLDLDDPVNTKNIDDAIKVVQDMEYGKMIEEVRKEEQKMKEKEEKQKKDKEKVMNELKDNHTATLMRDVVNQMVAAKVNEIKKENEEEDQEMQGEEPDEQHQEHQQGKNKGKGEHPKGMKGGSKDRRLRKKKLRMELWKKADVVQRQQQQRSKRFMELMEGASAQDWWWIKNYDLLEEKVAVYVPDLCEIQPVAMHGVPWPIVWILSRYNKKHIWASRKMPSIQNFEGEIKSFSDRVKWRWVFRCQASNQESNMDKKKVVKCYSVDKMGIEEAEIHQKVFEKSMYEHVADDRYVMDMWYKSYLKEKFQSAIYTVLLAMLDTNHRLVRIDIREFFVCGGLRELAEEALKAFDEDENPKKVVMQEVVEVLLGSQFVRSEAANLMYQVIEGMVEKDTLESVGIDLLLRYRDDILILASSYEKFLTWFQFSEVEDKEVQFLQFRVQMNAKSRRLFYAARWDVAGLSPQPPL
ncbi:unnamed protein product [Symbiodinium necroappetens]|uniref:Uncharacterized protein n=1 Tax=Symbiodinium necroappetens TaxID=1628268 RepID=A0A812PHM2_9DINO|nr:unnamed protein product [Symbiodinium necroappetens]